MTEGKILINYEPLLAPFYFKLGDFLLTYMMLNTDELGQVKPMTDFPEDSDAEEEEEVEGGAENEANGDEETKEESN